MIRKCGGAYENTETTKLLLLASAAQVDIGRTAWLYDNIRDIVSKNGFCAIYEGLNLYRAGESDCGRCHILNDGSIICRDCTGRRIIGMSQQLASVAVVLYEIAQDGDIDYFKIVERTA
jgi:hypothetical protein